MKTRGLYANMDMPRSFKLCLAEWKIKKFEKCIIMLFSYQYYSIICHTVIILSSLVLVSSVPKGGESEPTIKQETSAS